MYFNGEMYKTCIYICTVMYRISVIVKLRKQYSNVNAKHQNAGHKSETTDKESCDGQNKQQKLENSKH